MFSSICPACRAPVPIEDVNLKEGVALCRACGKVSRLIDVAAAEEEGTGHAAAETPRGCQLVGRGSEMEVRASTRSVGGAVFTAVFALFWNGIVSVFVLVAIGGLYTHLIGPLPSWFPAPPISQGNGPSKTASQMDLGEVLFLCVFLIPFVLIGMGMVCAFAVCMWGSVRVRIAGESGAVRVGVGPLWWTRRFDATKVRRVAMGRTTWTQNKETKPLIVIEADREVRFGSMLTSERRNWMLAVLRDLLGR